MAAGAVDEVPASGAAATNKNDESKTKPAVASKTPARDEFEEEERAAAPITPQPLPVIAPWKMVVYPLGAAVVLLALYVVILGRRQGPARS
jgi:hypothetical protein